MRCKTTGLVLGLLAVLLASVAEVQGGDKEKPLPPAKTPELAAKNFLTAVQAGNVEQMITQLGSPTREMFQAMFAQETQREQFQKLLDEKFGKDPKKVQRPAMREDMKKTKNFQIVAKEPAKDNKIVATFWITSERSKGMEHQELKGLVVKEGAAWKLVLAMGGGKSKTMTKKGPDGKEVEVRVDETDPDLANMAKMATWVKGFSTKMTEALEKLTKEVKKDGFKNREEAEKALNQAELRVFQENPPPNLEKSGEAKKQDSKDKN